MKKLIYSLILFVFSFQLFSQQESDTIFRVVEAIYQGSYDQSPKEAVEKAEAEAQQKAAEEIVGLYVEVSNKLEQQETYNQEKGYRFSEEFESNFKSYTSSVIRYKVLNDPYDYFFKNNGKVYIKIRAFVLKDEIDEFIKSDKDIEKEEKKLLANVQTAEMLVENIYGSCILTTTFSGKFYIDGNWFSDVELNQRITINYLKEGEHIFLIKGFEGKDWEKVIFITKGMQEELVASLKEFSSAIEFSVGTNLDLGPIFSFTKKTYPIEDRGRFLVWKQLGEREDIAYISDNGRIIICSRFPLRSLNDINAFYNNLTVLLFDYIAKVQTGITAQTRDNMWNTMTIYAQKENIYKRIIYVGNNIEKQYPLPFTLKVPNINVKEGRYLCMMNLPGWLYWDNDEVAYVEKWQAGGGDMTQYLTYGTHKFHIVRKHLVLGGYEPQSKINDLIIILETINDSSPQKLEITGGYGLRVTDNTPCWHIDELELPK